MRRQYGSGSITAKGYIRKNGVMVHRIVWERENGRIPDGFQVHHKDGNKENNNIDNLELLSALEHKRIHSECYKDEVGEWWKPCKKCGEYKRVESDYYKRIDGISPWCKSCCVANAVKNKRKRKQLS